MKFGFLIFPNITQLDFTAPIQFISKIPSISVYTIEKTKQSVITDCGFSIVPTHSFDEIGKLDAICIPGGAGIIELLKDTATIEFVKKQANNCKYITSVCTGAFLLGKAGLLQNKNATTHWAYKHLLPIMGANPTNQRVVIDGNVITGGGVTAGIDFAISFIEKEYGKNIANDICTALEYSYARNTKQEIDKNLLQKYQQKSKLMEQSLTA